MNNEERNSIQEKDLEPEDGVLAIPPGKDMIQYNIANLHQYCVERNIEMRDLSFEEKKMFVIHKNSNKR